MDKGRKEAYAPFGQLSDKYLRSWVAEYQTNGHDNIWGVNKWGITSMLRRLEEETSLPCNPHTFRRTFASFERSGIRHHDHQEPRKVGSVGDGPEVYKVGYVRGLCEAL
jgi:hypothetical protein